jgi:hypothetical protein
VIARGGLDRVTARHILDSGLWQLFLGIEEAPWLEAKRQHYRQTSEDDIAFATDVAAMCNSDGGLLILGMKTKHHPDGDRIVSVNQCPVYPGIARRYERLLRRLIFPAPDGVRVEALRRDKKQHEGLVVVDVPDQPARLRPFLVYGALIGRSVHGALIGVPTRHGADTEWLSAPALHARLRVGRSALDR